MSHFSLAVFCHDPEELDEIMAPYQEEVFADSPYAVFKPDDEGEETNPETGESGWWYNPNARWDWWVSGGRWDKMIGLKPDRAGYHEDADTGYADGAPVDDIDLEKTRMMGVLPPYAFIDVDGTWHAPGRMGWFGCDDSTESSREAYASEFWDYLAEANGLYLVIVDCHI